MTEPEKTEKIFEKYGGIVDNETYGIDMSHFINLCKDIEERLNKKKITTLKSPELKICLIDNPTVNAVVKRFGSIFYIGIYSGTFLVLQNLFMRMLASPRLFKDFGNPSEEIEHPKVSEIAIDDYRQAYKRTGPVVYPKNRERLFLANELTTLVVNHIAYHEYAHIILGHCNYTQSYLGAYAYSEQPTIDLADPAFAPIFRQVCESEADFFAHRQLYRSLEKLVAREDEYFKNMYRDIEVAVYLYVFSTYSYWKVLEGSPPKSFDRSINTHPSPRIRQFILIADLCNYYHYRYPDSDQSVQIALQAAKAVKDVNFAFAEISDQEFTLDFNSMEEDGDDYLYFITQNRDLVKEQLDPYLMKE